jgi:glycosyltransferase involved in cell wall biosynthesis
MRTWVKQAGRSPSLLSPRVQPTLSRIPKKESRHRTFQSFCRIVPLKHTSRHADTVNVTSHERDPRRPDSSILEDRLPLVSVIIPCYNGETYLAQAIESALMQTYQPVEIIVVDDGSTDNSPAIAQQYPVQYLRQQNRGLTPTRNLGIQQSKGDYLVFLDADDRIRPEAIEAGLSVMLERPECAMVIGDHVFISPDGAHLRDSHKRCLPASHYEALLRSNFIEMISSVLFRRVMLEQVGGFDTALSVAEDYELYLRIARNYPICSHHSVVAEYRMHQTNASRNSELMLMMTIQVLKRQAPFVRRHPRRVFAFLDGLRIWRRQYGRQFASELANSASRLHPGQLRRKLLLLGSYYPLGILMFLLLRAPAAFRRKSHLRQNTSNLSACQLDIGCNPSR